MASDSSERFVLLNRLADEFAARYRGGERPSLQEDVDRHPELFADIREFFLLQDSDQTRLGVVPNLRTNSLVVVATAPDLEVIEALLAWLDLSLGVPWPNSPTRR